MHIVSVLSASDNPQASFTGEKLIFSECKYDLESHEVC